MKNILYIIVSTLMLALFSLTAHAEIYKWTDENGKVHFSDKPVGEKAKALDIKVQKSNPSSAKTKDERKQRAEGFLRARQEEREEAEKKIAEKKRLKAKKIANCKKFKKEYKKTTEAGALYYKNKDGTRDWLEPKRRNKEEARLKAGIKKWCK